MLTLIALAYWLLCVRLQVCVDAGFSAGGGSISLSIGAFGVSLRHDMCLTVGKMGKPLCIEPRYPTAKKRTGSHRMRRRLYRIGWPYLRSIIRKERFSQICVHVRLGLGDAGATAVGCGAVHALLCALLVPAEKGRHDVRITPDFSGEAFCAAAQGIFLCQPGDIILAALKDARQKSKKTGKEGFRWKSIPLRA